MAIMIITKNLATFVIEIPNDHWDYNINLSL